MKRIMAGRRRVAVMLAAVLCLAGGLAGVGRERAGSPVLAMKQMSGDEVWEYEETLSGYVTITGYKGVDTQLHIPETIQDSRGRGLIVLKIAVNAFEDRTDLTSVEIPASVQEIENGVFRGCSNLREITVSEGNMYYDSREGCNAIIRENTNELVAGCQTSRIPDDVEIIGRYAFADCAMLTNVTFPNGLTRIEDSAFYGCSGITRIEIPAGVNFLNGSSFAGCSLEEIKVDEENTMYNDGDNSNGIFESTVLIVGGNHTVLPEGTTSIWSDAFNGREGLESIYIPSTVTWISRNAFLDCSGLQQVDFAEGSSVTEIAEFAFKGCKKLKSISLPAGITEVNPYTFRECSSLERVDVPEGVTEFGDFAFAGCSSLKEINFPEGLTSMGRSLFSDCACLTTAKIPDGITELGEHMFSGCTSLTEIEIPESVTKLGVRVFAECDSLTGIDLPDGITSIPDCAFYSCDKLGTISLPGTLTEIDDSAFMMCTSLTEAEIPEGVIKLGKRAFYQASSLKEVKLPNTLESIGEKAFVCTGIESLMIPKKVSKIGDGLFDGQGDTPNDWFTSIRRITVDEENATYDSRDGSNAIIETKTDTLLYGSNATTKIPEGVTTIAKYAFSGCKDLESIEISSTVDLIAGHIFTKCNGLSQITVSEDNPQYNSRDHCNAILRGNTLVVGCKGTKIPANVNNLEIAAFSGCTALTEIELPSNLEKIPEMAFMSCSSLKSIKIPDRVTSIGTYAFHYCAKLESVYIPQTVHTFDGFNGKMGNVFLGCPDLTIYTKEGADAVEFAKEFKIPYSFDAMPGETKSPAETVTPAEIVTPQKTPVPAETSSPLKTSAPQQQTTEKPNAPKTAKPDIKKPAKPKIKKLKNKPGKKVTVTLSKKVAGATGYQVAYAVKSSMKGQKKKSFRGTSVTIKKLKRKKTYYFRVRAFVKKNGKTVYGSWGGKKSIKIKK